jgi:hypothetical protein
MVQLMPGSRIFLFTFCSQHNFTWSVNFPSSSEFPVFDPYLIKLRHNPDAAPASKPVVRDIETLASCCLTMWSQSECPPLCHPFPISQFPTL